MNNLYKAKNVLSEKGCTCVLYKDGEEYSSHSRGVKPLIDFLETGKSFKGFSAADKTVGAGAAHLYILLHVSAVYARVISEEGKRLLEQNNISVEYDNLVPFIINRSGDGPCPIETAVKGADSSGCALNIIKQTLAKLKG